MNDAAASLRYTDLRALVEHAAKRFPDTGFFLCADEKLPSVTGAELYSLCKRAAGVRRRKYKAKTRKRRTRPQSRTGSCVSRRPEKTAAGD